MDAGLVEQVLTHIHNWFERSSQTVTTCTISGGELPASLAIPDGAWYLIKGSLLNDGLHQHPSSGLIDETFSGSITLCAIPKSLLAAIAEIEEWLALTDESRKKALASPYQSESFDGYTYTLKSDTGAQNGSSGLSGWQAEFASRLNAWKKMY